MQELNFWHLRSQSARPPSSRTIKNPNTKRREQPAGLDLPVLASLCVKLTRIEAEVGGKKIAFHPCRCQEQSGSEAFWELFWEILLNLLYTAEYAHLPCSGGDLGEGWCRDRCVSFVIGFMLRLRTCAALFVLKICEGFKERRFYLHWRWTLQLKMSLLLAEVVLFAVQSKSKHPSSDNLENSLSRFSLIDIEKVKQQHTYNHFLWPWVWITKRSNIVPVIWTPQDCKFTLHYGLICMGLESSQDLSKTEWPQSVHVSKVMSLLLKVMTPLSLQPNK